MTVKVRATTITCDGCGERIDIEDVMDLYPMNGTTSVAVARAEAVTEGWLTAVPPDGECDFCPDCAVEIER